MEVINIDFYDLKEGVNDDRANILIRFAENILGARIQYLDEDEIAIIFD